MTLPITLFGAMDCDDTQRTRACLIKRGIQFCEINIDHEPDAERFVIYINAGFRSTPTLVIGEGKIKIILTEPDDTQLDEVLASAQHSQNLFTPYLQGGK